jgi:hypothetical protein
MDIKNQYKTESISLASYLLTQGISFLGIVSISSGHFSFILSDSQACLELKQKFLNNALAPAQELFSKREMLISEIKRR